VIEFKL